MIENEIETRREHTNRMRNFYEMSEAYFEMLSETSSEAREDELELYTRIMTLYSNEEEKILDLGCGRGTTTGKLAVGDRFIIGVDLSLKLLQARDRALHGVGWVVATADRLPFREKTFSVVGMNSVLEHVTDVPAVLEELTRVIVPGGKAVIVSPNLLTPVRPIKALLGLDRVSIRFYGNRRKAFFSIFGNIFRILLKRLSLGSRFLYREPDLEHFEGPDDDATWYCNSLDILRWFRRMGIMARRVPLPLDQPGIVSRLKNRLSFLLPDLDKGFCIVVEKSFAAEP